MNRPSRILGLFGWMATLARICSRGSFQARYKPDPAILDAFLQLLKRLGLLEEAHGKVISRLVTDVTLPAIFLLGTLIAIHYGGPKVSAAERARASLRYFQSPIFFAFAIGLALSVVTLPAVFVLL